MLEKIHPPFYVSRFLKLSIISEKWRLLAKGKNNDTFCYQISCLRCRMISSCTRLKHLHKSVMSIYIFFYLIHTKYLPLDCSWDLENQDKKLNRKSISLFYNAYHDYTDLRAFLFYIKLFIHIFVLSTIPPMSWRFDNWAIYPFQVKPIHENGKLIDVFSKYYFLRVFIFLVNRALKI